MKDLLLQLIFGSQYHIVFYYQFILIFLTALFTIISILFHKNFVFVSQILLIIAYFFQCYWNLYIFKEYPGAKKYSLGNILELLPFAVEGITLRHLDIIARLKKFKKSTIFFSLVISLFILEFEVFIRIGGFWYPGILLSIGGNCIFIIFSLFSFQNKTLLFILKFITKFTGGIYYIHLIFFNFLSTKIDFIKKRHFLAHQLYIY